jgi:hypothetical protein
MNSILLVRVYDACRLQQESVRVPRRASVVDADTVASALALVLLTEFVVWHRQDIHMLYNLHK